MTADVVDWGGEFSLSRHDNDFLSTKYSLVHILSTLSQEKSVYWEGKSPGRDQ